MHFGTKVCVDLTSGSTEYRQNHSLCPQIQADLRGALERASMVINTIDTSNHEIVFYYCLCLCHTSTKSVHHWQPENWIQVNSPVES